MRRDSGRQDAGKLDLACDIPLGDEESEADGFAPSNSAFTPEEVPQQMDGAGGETALEDQTSSFNFDSGSVYGRLLIFAIICGAAVCGVLVFTCRGSRRSSPASYKALSTAEGETEVHSRLVPTLHRHFRS